MFFSLEGGWPEERADWRAGAITAMIANFASGLGGSRKTYQPGDFYPNVIEPGQEPEQVAATEAPQPTEEDLAIMNRLVTSLRNHNGTSM